MVYLDQLKLDGRNLKRLVPVELSVSFTNYDLKVHHTILGGRIREFPQYFSVADSIPILPNSPFGKLIVNKYHYIHHKQVDTVVAYVRSNVWIIGVQKIASKIDRNCVTCIRSRKTTANQRMGDLPNQRFDEILPAWSCVNMDLFGPLEIRDEVIKSGPNVCKKKCGV